MSMADDQDYRTSEIGERLSRLEELMVAMYLHGGELTVPAGARRWLDDEIVTFRSKLLEIMTDTRNQDRISTGTERVEAADQVISRGISVERVRLRLAEALEQWKTRMPGFPLSDIVTDVMPVVIEAVSDVGGYLPLPPVGVKPRVIRYACPGMADEIGRAHV